MTSGQRLAQEEPCWLSLDFLLSLPPCHPYPGALFAFRPSSSCLSSWTFLVRLSQPDTPQCLSMRIVNKLYKYCAGKMAQWIKALATKADNLNLSRPGDSALSQAEEHFSLVGLTVCGGTRWNVEWRKEAGDTLQCRPGASRCQRWALSAFTQSDIDSPEGSQCI